jgi:hypothetical protein
MSVHLGGLRSSGAKDLSPATLIYKYLAALGPGQDL